jgi:hypothetical protein
MPIIAIKHKVVGSPLLQTRCARCPLKPYPPPSRNCMIISRQLCYNKVSDQCQQLFKNSFWNAVLKNWFGLTKRPPSLRIAAWVSESAAYGSDLR